MKKILIVVDMQNDFIDGSLGTKEAQSIVPNVVKTIQEWDGPVWATYDTHHKDYLETLEGKELPIPHCIIGTNGWDLEDSVMDAIESKKSKDFIMKYTFGSIRLKDFLDVQDGDTITLIGLCTDICVISNALLLRAANPNTKISVISKCCAGVTPEKHQAALEVMRSCQINVL